MKLGTVVVTSFIIGFCITLFGAYLKMTHAENADTWLTAGFIVTLVFVATAIYEVRQSERVNNTEKMLWTLAFIFFSGIAGLVYLLFGRKRMVS